MKTTLAVAACFAGASAFAPAAKSSKATALRDVWDDYVGGIKYDGTEFKFDPLGLSESYSPFVPFFRESELRHGRTAMLAVVGYIVGDIVRLPGEMYSFESIPHAAEAHDALMFNGPMTQIAAYISLWDIIVTAPAIAAMKEGREPGDYGLTMLAPKDAAGMKLMKEKELLNGRLAMIAIGGIATQTALTGHGFPYL